MIKLGDQVRTSDGHDVGNIDKLILDPSSGEVKAAVVRKGFILHDDVEVPLSAFQAGSGGIVRLTYTADQVNELPRFSEGSYTTPPPGYVSPYGYPAGGLLWPVGWWPGTPPVSAPSYGSPDPVSREVAAGLRQQDWANAVIDEGSDVISRDGEKVGEIESVTIDPATGQPASLIVRKGFLFTEDLTLPAETISSVDDRVVYLTLDKAEAEAYVRG